MLHSVEMTDPQILHGLLAIDQVISKPGKQGMCMLLT